MWQHFLIRRSDEKETYPTSCAIYTRLTKSLNQESERRLSTKNIKIPKLEFYLIYQKIPVWVGPELKPCAEAYS